MDVLDIRALVTEHLEDPPPTEQVRRWIGETYVAMADEWREHVETTSVPVPWLIQLPRFSDDA